MEEQLNAQEEHYCQRKGRKRELLSVFDEAVSSPLFLEKSLGGHLFFDLKELIAQFSGVNTDKLPNFSDG